MSHARDKLERTLCVESGRFWYSLFAHKTKNAPESLVFGECGIIPEIALDFTTLLKENYSNICFRKRTKSFLGSFSRLPWHACLKNAGEIPRIAHLAHRDFLTNLQKSTFGIRLAFDVGYLSLNENRETLWGKNKHFSIFHMGFFLWKLTLWIIPFQARKIPKC